MSKNNPCPLSPAELYSAYLNNKEPTFYTRIPHILSYLTYDYVDPKTGEKSVKKLSVYARELYRVIKSVANDTNACWMNRDSLAEMCGCSAGSITNAKEELCQKFHQLDGTSLIEITESKKNTSNDKTSCGTTYHRMRINDIWGYNNAFMRMKKTILTDTSPSCGDSEASSPSCGDSVLPDTPSCGDTNNNHNNKNQLSKEQQPPAVADSVDFVSSVSFVSLDQEKDLFPSDEKLQKAYDWLIKMKCKPKQAKNLVQKYTPGDFDKASAYTCDQFKKKRAKGLDLPDFLAYLTDTLKNRYWEQKKTSK